MEPRGLEGGRKGKGRRQRAQCTGARGSLSPRCVPEPESSLHRAARRDRPERRHPGRPGRGAGAAAAPGLGGKRCGKDGGGGARASAAAPASRQAAAPGRTPPRSPPPAPQLSRAPHHAAGPRAPVRLPPRALRARAPAPR